MKAFWIFVFAILLSGCMEFVVPLAAIAGAEGLRAGYAYSERKKREEEERLARIECAKNPDCDFSQFDRFFPDMTLDELKATPKKFIEGVERLTYDPNKVFDRADTRGDENNGTDNLENEGGEEN